MATNVGGLDRTVRLVLGPILLVVALAALLGLLALELLFALVALVVGAVLTVTGVVQECPMNRLLGLNTYQPKTEAEVHDFSSKRARR